MKIDLIYNYRSIDTSYIIYGPEKIGSNIEVSTDGYIVNSISEVISKINSMVASLAPEITNCQSISSGLYGNMYMQTWRGDLNSGSDVPDYTSILTSINTNLSLIKDNILKFANCFCGNTNDINATSFIRRLLLSLTGTTSTSDTNLINGGLSVKFSQLISHLRQSVSPNASITDVISSLNTNIHNDLTNINTTENNKDTVLIIDGQQEFKLHKDDE